MDNNFYHVQQKKIVTNPSLKIPNILGQLLLLSTNCGLKYDEKISQARIWTALSFFSTNFHEVEIGSVYWTVMEKKKDWLSQNTLTLNAYSS